jgi:hypothetical protein
MNPGYRCCDCTPQPCCQVWCECPEEICISTGTWVRTVELYSCDNQATPPSCGVPDGTLLGELHQTIKLVGVRLRKVTTTGGSCSPCCKYVVLQGAEQDGRIVTTHNSWYVNCLERDGDECVSGNRTCVGTADVPLSGSVSGQYFSEVSGELRTECCDTDVCSSSQIRAVLQLNAEGNRSAGSETDCCTQLTTTPTIYGKLGLTISWDCRHESRWEGTCPADLLEEPFQAVAVPEMRGCTYPYNPSQGSDPIDCPCPTGPGWDYVSPCLVTGSSSLFVCKTLSESFVPILGNTISIVAC